MTFKFEGRGMTVDQPSKIPIIDERTGEPFKATVDGKTYEAYIEGYSVDSRRAVALKKVAEDKRAANGKRKTTAEEREKVAVEVLSALTVSWCIVTPDGDIIDEPYTEAAGLAFFAAPEWAMYRFQYEVGLATQANFMKRATKP